MNTAPKVSVIVPTLDAENTIARLLALLKRQRPAVPELIVVDSASADSTAAIAAAAGARVITIRRQEFDHGLTRNLGAVRASGDILVFMTQDASPVDEDTIRLLVEPVAAGTAAASYARQIPPADADPIETFWRNHNYPEKPAVKTFQTAYRRYFFSNVCSAFRADLFFALGGFEATVIGEDTLMAYRLINAGHAVAYQSTARVFHAHDLRLAEKISRYYKIGAFNQAHRYLTAEASHESDGIATVRKLLAQLWRTRQHRYIAVALADMFTRYMAYAAGRLVTTCGKTADRVPSGRLAER